MTHAHSNTPCSSSPAAPRSQLATAQGWSRATSSLDDGVTYEANDDGTASGPKSGAWEATYDDLFGELESECVCTYTYVCVGGQRPKSGVW